MKENNVEKNLLNYEDSFFHKIKSFFKRLFMNEKVVVDSKEIVDANNINTFREDVIYNEKNADLLKLQEQFEAGKISENDLTEEQIRSLTELYGEQIEN